MARYKEMTETQKAARDSDLLDLQAILLDSKNAQAAQKLSRITGKAYSTILQIKKGVANPSHATVKALLRGCEQL